MLLKAFSRPRVTSFFKHKPLQSIIARKLHEGSNSYAAEKLCKRRLVRVSGETSFEFLQGLITNDMKILEQGAPSIYTLLLNNKGRVLFDVIIYRTKQNNSFLLECDAEIESQLIKHLTIFKVRRKIDFTPVNSEFSVWAIYNSNLIDCCLNSGEFNEATDGLDKNVFSNKDVIVVADPRLSTLGYRAVVNSTEDIACLPKNDAYRICRYKLGIAEGIDEIELAKSFPLEINCDFLNGVSFDKGCYIGQELTARTYHVGSVRKRIMPLIFDPEPSGIPPNTLIDEPDVSRRTPIGKLKAYSGKYGLGLMRVSETLEAKNLKMLDIVTRSDIPFWWPTDYTNKNYIKAKIN